ncbi:DUF2079 domain-containing protein [Bdellovibrionota bacterium FG-2]
MKSLLLKIFSISIWIFSVAVSLMILTGGGRVRIPQGPVLEFSSVDLWVLICVLLVGLHSWLAPGKTHGVVLILARWVERFQNPQRSKRALASLFVLVFGGLFLAHCLKHLSFRTDMADMTFLHQALFHPFSRPVLQCDFCPGGSFLGAHLAFSLGLPGLIMGWIQSDTLVFLLQVFAVAGPLWVGFRLGPLRGRPERWFWVGFIILANRSLRNSLIWDFREDHLIFAFLLGACLSLYRSRVAGFFGFLILALFSKENVAWIALFFVFPVLYEKRMTLSRPARWKVVVAVLGLCLIWGIFSFRVLIPHFSGAMEKAMDIPKRFPGLGGTPQEVLQKLLFSPAVWWMLLKTKLFSFSALKYGIFLLGPFLFFARKGWVWLFPVIPGLAMNLLSSMATQRSMEFHYDLVILPFLVMALWSGVERFSNGFVPQKTWMTAVVLALCFSGRWPAFYVSSFWPTQEEAHAAADLRRVGAGGLTAASSRGLAHLSTLSWLSKIEEPQIPEWEAFWQVNPGLLHADRLIWDQSQGWQKQLAQEFLKRGARDISSAVFGHPAERFLISTGVDRGAEGSSHPLHSR